MIYNRFLRHSASPCLLKRNMEGLEMADEHLKTLDAALEKLRAHRRALAENLAGNYKRGHTEGWCDQLVQVQATIDALLRAVEDERCLNPDLLRAKKKSPASIRTGGS